MCVLATKSGLIVGELSFLFVFLSQQNKKVFSTIYPDKGAISYVMQLGADHSAA